MAGRTAPGAGSPPAPVRFPSRPVERLHPSDELLRRLIMLTGEIRNQVDRIWDAFWSGGISNPLEVIEER
jgi:hypothetical protein